VYKQVKDKEQAKRNTKHAGTEGKGSKRQTCSNERSSKVDTQQEKQEELAKRLARKAGTK